MREPYMKRFRMTRKRALITGSAVLLVAWLVYMFLPDPVPVQTAAVTRGPLQVIVEEEGETRLEDRYVITAPVAAYVRRMELEAGDRVEAGQVVVRLEPPRGDILDPRTGAQADARIAAARAAVAQAEIAYSQATAELERMERLHAAEAATRQALERATTDAARARAELEGARAELAAAQAARRTAAGAPALPVADEIRAPAGGRVLAVHHPSGGQVMPGEPLLEVGDTERLHVVAEVLSQDAVRIRPGAPVLLDEWGGDTTLEAVVRQVDPQGFARVSALGVEERRVRVLADLASPPADYAGLGPGFRVLARFVVWQSDNVLRVPTAALFRHDDGWAAFVVHGRRASLRPVVVGQQAGLAAQVVDGLAEGETVIVHPGNDVTDGGRVRVED
jgi:HlyD family secretion protein